MTQTIQILCDYCTRDLTYTGNSVDYRLSLKSEDKLPWYLEEGLTGGMVTDALIHPAIDKPAHFCGIGCLRSWLDEHHPAESKQS